MILRLPVRFLKNALTTGLLGVATLLSVSADTATPTATPTAAPTATPTATPGGGVVAYWAMDLGGQQL
jgi:hypothetical protein